MSKKTILIHSNHCKAFTGFGKNKKNILKYLYRTGKYNIVEASNGKVVGDPSLGKLPWKAFGTVPHNYNFLSDVEKRAAGYGAHSIDAIIQEVKPDIYLGIEDIWAFSQYHKKSWWNKINTMIWTTLDSEPILQEAIDFAPKTKNYYVWASFAEREMKKLGYDHVKTLRGSIDDSHFFRLPDEHRQALRQRHNLGNQFIIGFVFRNQLRKSVPNLLDGFKLFKERNPNSDAKLLLHTHWSEGWDIPRFLKEKNINPVDVLTTYFCSQCGEYFIAPFSGQEKKCSCCGSEKSVNTTNISHGVSEQQLNEVYNLMDVYCHPFTSGGQEIPIQEAKLTELITLVTNYSCGEDNCSEESGGIPLKWSEYREPGTQFIKASTHPSSIAEKLELVYNLPSEDKEKQGKKSRQWVLDNFSVEVIGKKLEKIFDSMPNIDYDFKPEKLNFDFKYIPPSNLSDEDYVIDAFNHIMVDAVDKNTSYIKPWINKLKTGSFNRETLILNLRNVASQEAQNLQRTEFSSLFTDDDKGNRIAVVIPKSSVDVFYINSLMGNLKDKYPQSNIYVFTEPQFFELIEDNPAIYKCLPYSPSIDNPFLLEGKGDHEGYFNIAYFPHVTTQKFPTFIHNGLDI